MNRDCSILEAALSYAARGWPVFPIYSVEDGSCSCQRANCTSPGKHPRTIHGLKDATTDDDQIHRWWKMWPTANLGLPTGTRSGVWVLDVDPLHGGVDTLTELEATHGRLPESVEVLTGGGGRHVYFRWTHGGPRNSESKLGPGLDVRGEGGYVLLPPSRHVSGGIYEFEASSHPDDQLVVDAPEWLLRLATMRVSTESHQAESLPGRIPEGQRNSKLTSLAGTLRRHDASRATVEAALLAENAERCDPPLGDDEVRRIAASAMRWSEHQSKRTGAHEKSPENVEPQALIWRTAVDVGLMTPEKVAWCVEGVVASGAITEISAPVKTGKTTFVGCMVRAVLNGDFFLGRPTRKMSVVWLTEERSPTFRNMFARVGLLDHPNLHILFRHETHGMPWADVVAGAVRKAQDTGSGMIVIDTLSGWTRLAGDEENSAGSAMAAMEPIHVAAGDGFGVILNRHDRKGGGILGESGRGSSAYAGEVDILLQLKRATNPGNTSRREISATGRFDGIIEKQFVEYRDGQYVYLGDSSNVERLQAKSWLLEYLPDLDGTPFTKSEISKNFEPPVSNTTRDRSLKELVEEGLVGKGEGYGPNKKAFGYWLTGKPDEGPGIDDLTTKESTPGEVIGGTPHRNLDSSTDLTTPRPPGETISDVELTDKDGQNVELTPGDDVFRGQSLNGEVDCEDDGFLDSAPVAPDSGEVEMRV